MPLIFTMNQLDQNLIFRDQETKEVFIFHVNGVWNEETLNHKLIN